LKISLVVGHRRTELPKGHISAKGVFLLHKNA